jgi:hypothetical protein
MALDELIARNVGILNKYAASSMRRWRDATNAAVAQTYTQDAFFKNVAAQFAEAWETWLSLFETEGSLPTIVVIEAAGALAGATASALVGERVTGITNATCVRTPLQNLGGGAAIAAGDWEVVGPSGDFDGGVEIRMRAAAPAAGTYRGLLFHRKVNQLKLLAEVVVHAT